MQKIGYLKIKVVNANLLQDTDLFGKMDPYVQIKYGKFNQKTTVKHSAGKTPIWNQDFKFQVVDYNQKLQIILKQEDYGPDQFLGSTIIDINTYVKYPNKAQNVDCFIQKKNKENGKCQLIIEFEPCHMGKLYVKVKKANLTRDTQTFGKMDPYAILTYGTQKRQTSIKGGAGKTPQWNQQFIFEIVQIHTPLQITLNDQDIGKDDLVGQATIKIYAGIQGQKDFPLYYKQQQCGTITLQFKIQNS